MTVVPNTWAVDWDDDRGDPPDPAAYAVCDACAAAIGRGETPAPGASPGGWWAGDEEPVESFDCAVCGGRTTANLPPDDE